MVSWRTLYLLTLEYFLHISGSVFWPAGLYGIPKATSGCPYTKEFQWLIGRRYQDTEDDNPNNHKSSQFHLDATVDSSKGIIRSFCMKTDTSTDWKRSNWPPGKYCIYKKGGSCPINLRSGFIKWDDEDNNNKNNKTGTLPDGVYDHNTKIEFCCRTDGDKNSPISLPTLKPFFLLAYDSAECQQVKWAVVTVEWIRFDNEDSDNADGQGGSHPHGAGIDNHKIHYCYYQECNKTLTGLNGTFHSPNYPNKYPDGQFCSWGITVNPLQQVHLTFTNFSLQSESNTDALFVYDGENATGDVLGVFFGGQTPPKGGIYSTSSHMFLIFKSDKNISYTGFSALYNAVNCSGSSCITVPNLTQTTKLTPSGDFLSTSYSFAMTMLSIYTTTAETSSVGKVVYRSTETVDAFSPRSHTLTPSPSFNVSPSQLPLVTSSAIERPLMTSQPKTELVTSINTKATTEEPTEPTKPSESTDPTKEGGRPVEARRDPREKGVNVTAVVVPLVLLVLLAALVVAGLCYYKRRMLNNNDGLPKEVMHMSESPFSLENPCYFLSEEANNVDSEMKIPKENEYEAKLDQESSNTLYESTA